MAVDTLQRVIFPVNTLFLLLVASIGISRIPLQPYSRSSARCVLGRGVALVFGK